ncbi:universal stress protein [Streptomyces abikoensis]|uniref:universal stress protein n=1 Tax=Streptomyces abikoensis TaxID=97398 RepID=UPI001E416E59|nr:universal stress protein [Streptomyces abikoensis]
MGVDGSDESLSAVTWAACEAVTRGTALRILHALEWRTSNQQFSAGAPAQQEWARSRIEEARQELAAARPGLRVDAEEVDELPAKALLDAAREAELLVLGSRGLGGFEGWLLGSVSLAVIAHAAVPVVLVRAGWEPPAAGADGPIVVGVGRDGSYDPLLEFAFPAAAAGGAVLRVVEAGKDAQLLVVGRRMHRPAFGAHIGPVTHAAVHHTGCPVAVVPHS